MKMDELVQGFMVDLDVDSKNGSVAGHSIDMCLRLVAAEYNAKPWNKNKQFLQFLDERGAHAVLFSLALNPAINNRLACLVREVMELPYLQPVFAVIACLGVQLVKPFYANIILRKDRLQNQADTQPPPSEPVNDITEVFSSLPSSSCSSSSLSPL